MVHTTDLVRPPTYTPPKGGQQGKTIAVASHLIRVRLRKLEERINFGSWDDALSGEIDRLINALEELDESDG